MKVEVEMEMETKVGGSVRHMPKQVERATNGVEDNDRCEHFFDPLYAYAVFVDLNILRTSVFTGGLSLVYSGPSRYRFGTISSIDHRNDLKRRRNKGQGQSLINLPYRRIAVCRLQYAGRSRSEIQLVVWPRPRLSGGVSILLHFVL